MADPPDVVLWRIALLLSLSKQASICIVAIVKYGICIYIYISRVSCLLEHYYREIIITTGVDGPQNSRSSYVYRYLSVYIYTRVARYLSLYTCIL